MPPLPEITNVYRCAFNWALASQRVAANVIHTRTSVFDDAQAVAEQVRDAASAAQWGPVHSSVGVEQIVVTKLDGTSASYELDVTADAAWQGQTDGQYVPQVAAVVKFTTSQRGRSKRGRLFMPYIAEAAMQDGLILDLGPVQSAWEDFVQNLDLVSCPLVVASYKLESAQDVIGVLAETRIATQRRRNRRT